MQLLSARFRNIVADRLRPVAPAYLAAFLLLVVFNYAHFTYRREVPRIPYLTGFDDLGYYVYARSLVFDGDINFANDYAFIVKLFGDKLAGPPIAQLLEAAPARPTNQYNIGTGLAAIPWLLLFREIAQIFSRFGLWPSCPGPFSSWYVLAYLTGNLFYGVLGLWLTSRILSRWFSQPVVHMATFSCVLGGPALFYFAYQPGMSHLTSLCLVALALSLALAWDEESRPSRRGILAACWGLCVGFALTVRAANLPLILLAFIPATKSFRNACQSMALELIIAGAGLLIGFLPQMLAWSYLYGHPIANPVRFSAALWPPNFFSVLLGRRHGLFFWHPWLLVAAGGLLAAGGLALRLRVVAGVVLLAMTWIYGNWRIYWLGVSFGMRGYVEFLPLFALGAARVIEILHARFRSWRAVAGILAIFALLNFHLLICFRGAVITVDGPLYWSQTLRGGRDYFAQLAREWQVLTSWRWGASAGERAYPWEEL
jgi:hypothetical protein